MDGSTREEEEMVKEEREEVQSYKLSVSSSAEKAECPGATRIALVRV